MTGTWVSDEEMKSVLLALAKTGVQKPEPGTVLGDALKRFTNASVPLTGGSCPSDPDPADDDMYLGGCPICGGGEGMIWTDRHTNWYYCEQHRTCWSPGNAYGDPGLHLFSDEENEAGFQKALSFIQPFTIVVPAYRRQDCAMVYARST
ncbi:MAG: hypothetical protein JNK25_03545 [Phycisphaerae bacterium]|nr:hypothetical protein [Phycisphaerae bacterium]